jgi:hypothetical protein
MIGSSFRDNLFEMMATQMPEGTNCREQDDEESAAESDSEIRFDYTHDVGVPSYAPGSLEAKDIGALKSISAVRPSRESAEWSQPYSVTDRVDLSAGAFQLLLCA